MYRLAIAFGLLAAVSAIPVDNGVTGDPEIECGPTSIQVTFNTQNAFSGHVYVKNRFAEVRALVSSFFISSFCFKGWLPHDGRQHPLGRPN